MEVNFNRLNNHCTNNLRVYSVIKGENRKSEFEIFEERIEEFAQTHPEEISFLKSAIKAMKGRGVNPRYLNDEGPAYYLPRVFKEQKDKNEVDFGIRLYLLWLNHDLIVLLNGGIKTKLDPNECPNVCDHCNFAIELAKRVNKAIKANYIIVKDEHPLDDFPIDI